MRLTLRASLCTLTPLAPLFTSPDAALTGVKGQEVIYKFPACGIEKPKWMMDEAAGSLCVKGMVPGLRVH